MTPASDRNETCPTCGSNKRHVFIGPPCILSPDDTYDPWHDSEPDGWVHDGTCCTNAAGMPNCFDPAPTPAPRDEAHGEVVLWRYGTELFDTRRPPPEVEHYEYVAVPAAQRERERAEVRELREALKLLLAAASEFKSVPGWRDGPRHDAIDRACIQADAALRRGESKED